MHPQQFGALRDIAAAIRQYPLNVFPFDAGKGWDRHGRLPASAFAIPECFKRRKNLLHVNWFAEVMVGAALDCLNRGRDTSITGQHNDRDGGIQLPLVPDYVEPGFASHFQVHDGQVGGQFDGESSRRGAVGGAKRFPAAKLERPAQPFAKPLVVIDDQHCRLILIAHRY